MEGGSLLKQQKIVGLRATQVTQGVMSECAMIDLKLSQLSSLLQEMLPNMSISLSRPTDFSFARALWCHTQSKLL